MVEGDALMGEIAADSGSLLLALAGQRRIAPTLDNALLVKHGPAVANQVQRCRHCIPLGLVVRRTRL